MNAIIYNLCMLLGVMLVGIGDALTHGLPHALMVVGALLIVLTAFAAFLVTRRG